MADDLAPHTPIPLLNTAISKTYTHIHPLLIAGLYAYKFSAIVADPQTALSTTLFWLAGLQTVFVGLCLPPVGSGVIKEGEKGQGGRVGKRKAEARAKEEAKRVYGNPVPLIFYTLAWMVLSILIAAPIISLVLILFGAPASDKLGLTFLCAAHMALLTAVPAFYVHGLDWTKAKEVVAMLRPIDEVHGGLVGTLVGAWLGAVPIPLDWDREWQKYPVTIVAGAYIGYTVGLLLGGTLLKGKRITLKS